MKYLTAMLIGIVGLFAQCPPCSHQTANLTVPLPEDSLPYRVQLELANFTLPVGLQSYAFAVYKGEWLLLAGRTNGLHNVDNTDLSPDANSFPVSMQNRVAYVVNPGTGAFYSRSLDDPSSGLSPAQIDLLSVTNSLYYQNMRTNTLYLVGGYGIDTATQTMGTKAALTAIDVPNFIKWIKNKSHSKSAARWMRFTSHPLLKLTGGVMWQSNEHRPFLLAFGQNFSGYYVTSSDGSYSRQIRPIQIIDNGSTVTVQPYTQPAALPSYRRRDLNVVPIVKKVGKSLVMSYSALSGVFTPYSGDNPGAWTVPIDIGPDGAAQMLDPNDPSTLAQAMNNYNCASMGLYSAKNDMMYTLLFGGISAAIVSDGSNCNESPNPQDNCCTAWLPAAGTTFTSCCNLPFSNDITTVSIDSSGVYRQYLMSEKYPIVPYIPLTCPGYTPPPGTHLWFGANAVFIPADNLPMYPNEVVALDKLDAPTFVGYIVGGIASVITDTNCPSDSQASRYVFKVTILPR